MNRQFLVGGAYCYRLLFKNIKIAPPVGGAKVPKRISLSFFEPFSSFFEKPPFFEKNLFPKEQKRPKCLKNKTISKIRAQQSTSELSDDPWLTLYRLLKPFLLTVFKTFL